MITKLNKIWTFLLVIAIATLFIACNDIMLDDEGCEESSIESMLLKTAESTSIYNCVILEGTLIFKADDLRCRNGGYYLEDSEGFSIFIRGDVENKDYIVSDISYLDPGSDKLDSIVSWDNVTVVGDYYPAKDEEYYAEESIICENQIGIDLRYIK